MSIRIDYTIYHFNPDCIKNHCSITCKSCCYSPTIDNTLNFNNLAETKKKADPINRTAFFILLNGFYITTVSTTLFFSFH